MIYCVVKKARNVLYGDVTDCMSKLVELVTYHKSKGGVFDITYNKGGRLETYLLMELIKLIFIFLVSLLQMLLMFWCLNPVGF